PAISAVRSFEWSLTTMTSFSRAKGVRSTASTFSSNRPMKRSSLSAGMIIESFALMTPVLLKLLQVGHVVYTNRFDPITGGERDERGSAHQPRNERQKISLASGMSCFHVIAVLRKQFQVRVTREAK